MRQLLDDIAWAWLMLRARRFRRNHGKKARWRFDVALQPRISAAEASEIAMNWLDNLLTGPNAVIGRSGLYDGRDIERLLQGVKARLEALGTMEPCDVCEALVDSTADACSHCG